MDDDVLNLSIRKFLKKVGITSQREIEQTVRSALAEGKLADDGELNISMTLRLDHLQSDLVIEDQIKLN